MLVSPVAEDRHRDTHTHKTGKKDTRKEREETVSWGSTVQVNWVKYLFAFHFQTQYELI